MIPYFQFLTIPLGPIPIQVWGLFVALGVLIATLVAGRLAHARGLSKQVMWDLSFWLLLAGVIGARLFHVLFYDFSSYRADPLSIFAVWQGGLSITGGLLGALLAGFVFLKKKQLDIRAYVETAVVALPLGLSIGRIGCFLIHDHPGTLTDFFLGVRYPDGLVRHDLGLYQAISNALLFLVFLWMLKTKKAWSLYPIIFLLWYGVTRFFLDFLRATEGAIVDARFAGLTPAQYVSALMVVAGVSLMINHRRSIGRV